MFALVALVLFVCILAVYYLFLKPYWYWKRKNVCHVKPLPVVGNLGGFVFRTSPLAQCIQDIYAAFPDARYVGFHKLLQPTLLIKDPELIKRVTVRDWQVFSQHAVVVSEEVDPLWGNSIVAMKGNDEWRQMRSILSFAFTTSKLKLMFDLMKNCSNQLIKHIDSKNVNTATFDARDLFSKYTNDVIGSTAFGFSCNSFDHPENAFYIMGKSATNFEGLQALKFALNGLSPFFMTLFRVGIYSKSVKTFFAKIIKEALQIRKKYNIVRPDMLHLMMEAKSSGITDSYEDVASYKDAKTNSNVSNKLTIDDDLITAQALIFFIGGFDSTATVMGFTAYELARNPDVQDKLWHEVDHAYEDCNGNITYKALTDLKYLDMIVSESLRKWPSILVSDRAVMKPYTIEGDENNECSLDIDTEVCCAIPIFSIHRDPKHYPNPDVFDPERFNDENKVNIKPYTYLPFGSGPRGCIGSRFALLEIKLIIAEIVYRFEIVPVSKTEIPITLSARGFLLRPNNGITLGFRKRRHSNS